MWRAFGAAWLCFLCLVAPSARAQTLGQALNATGLTWSTGGDAPWMVQTNTTLDGLAVGSGQLGNGSFQYGTNLQSWIQTTVAGPCLVSFWWAGSDYFVLVDETNEAYLDNYPLQLDWITFTPGSHTLRWVVSGDGAPADAGVLDEVSIWPTGYPLITGQPASQSADEGEAGDCIGFSVQALTNLPTTYQWRFNGANMPNANSPILNLGVVTTNLAGTYSVVLTNAAGFAISSNATLTVNSNPLGASLGAPQYAWTTDCQFPWLAQGAGGGASVGYFDASLLGPWLETTMTGPGALSFSYSITPALVYSDPPFSYEYFGSISLYIDGTNQLWAASVLSSFNAQTVSGRTNVILPSGTHMLTWAMDGASATINQVQLVAPGRPRFLTTPASQSVAMGVNVTFSASAIGYPAPTYQWYFAGHAIPGATNDTLSVSSVQEANAGLYWLVASNSYGPVTSSNVTLAVLPAIGSSLGGRWSSFGGQSGRLAVAGTKAYVAAGFAGLAIYDISVPYNPVLLSSLLVNPANDVRVAGNYAYIATGGLFGNSGPPPYGGSQFAESSLEVADISNPNNPVVVGSVSVGIWSSSAGGSGESYALPQRLAQVGSRVYFCDGISGVKSIDVSSPTNPVASSGQSGGCSIVSPYSDLSMAVTNERVFFANGCSGLQIEDATDPASPVALGSCPSCLANDIQLAGSYAYVAAGAGGLGIFDVSNPSNPVLIASNNPPNGNAVAAAVSGNNVFVTDTALGLVVVDVTTPSHPVIVGHRVVLGQAGDIQLAGTYAYITATQGGLQVYDVSDPSDPMLTGFSSPPVGDVVAVQVTNQYAYLADSEVGLDILDVSTLTSPVWMGALPSSGQVQDVKLAGLYAYLASGSAGLQIVNVADPANPVLTGAFESASNALRVEVVGQNAFVADGTGGLQIINVHNAGRPLRAGSYTAVDYVTDVKVIGAYAYMADGTNGLVILDVSNVANPAKVGGSAAFYGGRLWVAGQYAYALDSSGRLFIIDVSNPVNPFVVGTSSDVSGVDLTVAGQYVFVSESSGIAVVDVSSPAQPAMVGILSVGASQGVRVSGNYAYSAAGSAGLAVAAFGQRPFITTQPSSRIDPPGSNATFSVVASGFTPLTYQWWLNGTNLVIGATNATLTLTNMQPAQVGTYTVALSNVFGTVTSFPATLSLTAPAPDFESGSITNSNGRFSFRWSAAADFTYQVQYTTNLTQGIWRNFGPPIDASGGFATASDAITNEQRFYRVVALP